MPRACSYLVGCASAPPCTPRWITTDRAAGAWPSTVARARGRLRMPCARAAGTLRLVSRTPPRESQTTPRERRAHEAGRPRRDGAAGLLPHAGRARGGGGDGAVMDLSGRRSRLQALQAAGSNGPGRGHARAPARIVRRGGAAQPPLGPGGVSRRACGGGDGGRRGAGARGGPARGRLRGGDAPLRRALHAGVAAGARRAQARRGARGGERAGRVSRARAPCSVGRGAGVGRRAADGRELP